MDEENPQYQVAGEDDHSFDIMHPDGSLFKVAKSALSSNLMDKIANLPSTIKSYVTGNSGQGNQGDSQSDSGDSQDGSDDSQGDSGDSNQSAAPGAPAQASAPTQAIPINLPPGMSQGQSAPNVSANAEMGNGKPDPNAGLLQGSPMDQLKQNLGDQVKATQDMAKVKQQEANATAKAYQDNIDQQKILADQYNQQRQSIQTQNDQLFNSVMNDKVDPHRYINSMSNGQKITTAISILLGGIGAGFTGGRNVGADMLERNIDQDIQAQKDNISKKNTLLNMNMQKYRDLGTAEAATRLQMNTMMQAQIAKAAAQSGSKQAAANAQMAIAQLKQSALPMVHQMAMAGVKAQILGAGGQGGGIQTSQEPAAMLADKDYASRRIVVGNKAYQAATPKDAEDIKNIQAEYEPVRKMVTELGELGPSALVPGSEANLRAHAIRARLTPMINKMHGLNRLSEEDIKVMQDQLRDPTSFKQVLNGGAMTSQFMKNLSEDLDSQYKTRLMGYQGTGKYKSFKPMGT